MLKLNEIHLLVRKSNFIPIKAKIDVFSDAQREISTSLDI